MEGAECEWAGQAVLRGEVPSRNPYGVTTRFNSPGTP
jgi:hypothetical protein